MKIITPKVHIIGETQVNEEGMTSLLSAIGLEPGEFETDAASGAERIIEVAGRLCYKSFTPRLNPNLTRVRRGNKPYIRNILQSGHGSVIEHGTVNLAITGCTPVLTHELVRHRAGVSPSQVSGRYCRISEIGFYWPDAFDRAMAAEAFGPEVVAQIEHEGRNLVQRMETFQGRLAALTGIDRMADFTVKKALTSAFRRFAPYGLETAVIITANHRALRHMIAMRNSTHAEEEIRKTFFALGHDLKARFPAIYQDMEIDHEATPWGREEVWKFSFDKV